MIKSCLICNALCKILQQQSFDLRVYLEKLYLMELTSETMLYGPSYYVDGCETVFVSDGFDRYDREKVFLLAKKFFMLNDIVPNHHNMFRFEQTLRTLVPPSAVIEQEVLDFIKRYW
jgi:hypothetical protein